MISLTDELYQSVIGQVYDVTFNYIKHCAVSLQCIIIVILFSF